MYTLPTSSHQKRSTLTGAGSLDNGMPARPRGHAERVMREIKELGASPYSFQRLEVKYLPHIIHPDEHITGVVYGRSKDGSSMLIATDKRVIYLDKKPFFVGEDEITYDIVSGISYGRSLFSSGIKLHTRIGDYEIHTFNKRCAENFVEYIESRCLEH